MSPTVGSGLQETADHHDANGKSDALSATELLTEDGGCDRTKKGSDLHDRDNETKHGWARRVEGSLERWGAHKTAHQAIVPSGHCQSCSGSTRKAYSPYLHEIQRCQRGDSDEQSSAAKVTHLDRFLR